MVFYLFALSSSHLLGTGRIALCVLLFRVISFSNTRVLYRSNLYALAASMCAWSAVFTQLNSFGGLTPSQFGHRPTRHEMHLLCPFDVTAEEWGLLVEGDFFFIFKL